MRQRPTMLEFVGVESDDVEQSLLPGGSAKRAPAAQYEEGTIFQTCVRRFSVLLLLMLLQSISSFELQRYADLLSKHIEITLFLTMLGEILCRFCDLTASADAPCWLVQLELAATARISRRLM
jgi:hypothetical protein